MKKIYLMTMIAIVAIAGACKKESKKNPTTSNNEFSIFGYWLADGNAIYEEYDEDGKLISKKETDLTAKPTTQEHSASSFVNFQFKNDSTTTQIIMIYDENLDEKGYEKTSSRFNVSNKTQNSFTLSINEEGNLTNAVEVKINNSNSMTLTNTKVESDGSKSIDIFPLKRAPSDYKNPAVN